MIASSLDQSIMPRLRRIVAYWALAVFPVSCQSAPQSNEVYKNDSGYVPPWLRLGETSASTNNILVHYLGWWGDGRHIHKAVDYDSATNSYVAQFISRLEENKIAGWLFEWYGINDLTDRSAQLLASSAAGKFKFAGIIDKGAFKAESEKKSAERLQSDKERYQSTIKYFREKYFSKPGYIKVDGKYLLLNFGVHESLKLDWEVMQRENLDVIFVHVHAEGFRRSVNSGAMAWPVLPSSCDTESQIGCWLRPLVAFYESASDEGAKYGKFAMGVVFPGFDDRDAKWGQKKVIPQYCGETFAVTKWIYDRFARSLSPTLQFNQIATWNDYEEGTAIEPGVSACVSINPESSVGESISVSNGWAIEQLTFIYDSGARQTIPIDALKRCAGYRCTVEIPLQPEGGITIEAVPRWPFKKPPAYRIEAEKVPRSSRVINVEIRPGTSSFCSTAEECASLFGMDYSYFR